MNTTINTPLQLITLGMKAMHMVEQHPTAEIDMTHFRCRYAGGARLCIGGAARVLIEGWSLDDFPTIDDVPMNHIEAALDNARKGKVKCMYLAMEWTGVGGSFPIADYHENRAQFYFDMGRFAGELSGKKLVRL